MPASDDEQNPRQPEPNWVDKWILYVSVAGVVAVIFYAGEARRQNGLIARSVEQEVLNNRPVLIGNGVETMQKTPDGVPMQVKVHLRNYGKTLAVGGVVAGEILIRAAGEPTPVDADCDEAGKLPKANIPFVDVEPAVAPNEAAEPMWVPTSDQPLPRANYGAVLYVVGCVYYFGLDREKRYFSDVCVTWVPKAPQEFQTCDDATRNYAH
ncbi:MAG: hypothetical protein WCA22_20065 [Candidatus Binatus sp.]